MMPYVVKIRPHFFWTIAFAIVAALAFGIFGILAPKTTGYGYKSCADFTTREDAQKALEAGAVNLDGNDHDGRACEYTQYP